MKKANHDPPRWPLRFLAWFCPPWLLEGIEGDLLEQFDDDVRSAGISVARQRLYWNVLRLFRPSIILRNRFLFSLHSIMIRSYITVASRNIVKRKLYSFINAVGLSIGIAFCILIYLFIQDESSFDKFHANGDYIYRMHSVMYTGSRAADKQGSPYEKISQVQLALAPTMKAEIPEVQYATHFCTNHAILRKDDKVFNESIVYVDADFFRMFSFPMQAGNVDKIFTSKDEIVLTPAIAEKYFGTSPALGQVLMLGDRSLTVTGIIDAPPANSSLQFQVLLPVEGWGAYHQRNLDMWMNLGFPTFVQLYPSATAANLQPALDQLTHKYMKQELTQWRERDKVPAGEEPYRIGFLKLTDIHLAKDIGWDKVSDPQYAWILGGIAVLILLIACINYISLALTSSARRRMEVGVRKVIGAYRRQLVYQFGFESVMLALLSMVIGFILVVLFLPAFNQFTGKDIALQATNLYTLAGISIGITVLVGLLAGCYPALYLSGFRPVQVLKGTFTAHLSAGFSRPLIIMQFAFSSFLIISSVIMYKQMEFVTTKDLGYNQHQLIVIPTQAGWRENSNLVIEQFRNRAAGIPSVVSVAGTDYPFAGNDWMVFGYDVNGTQKATYGFTVDAHYIKTLGIDMVMGRDFDPNNFADTVKTIIVNEALVKDMQWTDPLHERLNFHGRDPQAEGSRIIGVVKDFHFLSLAETIKPMFLTMDRNDGRLTNMLVRIDAKNIPATIAQLKKDFAAIVPGKPFEYSFLDENVSQQYASFNRWMNIMSLATGFAILISCLGLFGLAGINAVNRTREIGIRKVMGANLSNIFILLNRQFIILSLVAWMLAAPLAWYSMQQWLAKFQFHITMSWYLFAIAMMAGLVVALAAVSYHTVKAALVNPSESLKYE
ncbi:MAG TPA: ABC transporter permease [Ohtaekwangia sp.]|uniref:ABC transporter permease n=1 Tax=Ohtaekwangia sp. TaxID=2066019 RepID=UPI002F94092E